MTRFTSRLQAMQTARGGWLCLECRTPAMAKQKKNRCPVCAAFGKSGLCYFPSQKELKRAAELLLAERAGAISELRFHPSYPLIVNDVWIAVYFADASYIENNVMVVEDTKPKGGNRDPVAALKITLFEACYKPLIVRIT